MKEKKVKYVVVFILLVFFVIINRYWLFKDIKYSTFRGVPNFYTWILFWDINNLNKLNFKNYWNGNTMFPYEGALTFSENLLGYVPFAIPFYLFAKQEPVYTINLLSIFLLVFSGFLLFFILERLFSSFLISLFGSMFIALNPWLLKMFSLQRFHMLGIMFIPVMIYLFKKFIETEERKNIYILSFFYLWTFLLSIYLGVFFTIFLGIWIFLWFIIDGKIYSKGKLIHLIASTFIVWIIMTPIFFKYKATSNNFGMVRTIQDQVEYTGPWYSWFVAPDENFFWVKFTKLLPHGTKNGIVEYFTFPGLTVIIFFFLSFILTKMPNWLKSLKYTSLILIIFTFGPFLYIFNIKIPLPYYFLWYLFPPLKATRNPHRFAIFVVIIVSFMTVYLLKNLFEKYKSKNFLRNMILIILILFFNIETFTIDKSKVAINKNSKFFYKVLKEDDFKGNVLEFPVNIKNDLRAMVASVFHWKNIINGVSGFRPPLQMQLESELRKFPDDYSISLLKFLNVERIVVDFKELSELKKINKDKSKLIFFRKIKDRNDIKEIFKLGDKYIFSLESTNHKLNKFIPEKDFKVNLNIKNKQCVVTIKIDLHNENFSFNKYAPSKFSFTKSDKWKIYVYNKKDKKKIYYSEWSPPAIFNNKNNKINIEIKGLDSNKLDECALRISIFKIKTIEWNLNEI